MNLSQKNSGPKMGEQGGGAGGGRVKKKYKLLGLPNLGGRVMIKDGG